MTEQTKTRLPAPTARRPLSLDDATIPERSRRLMQLAKERVVFFDGSMGTQIFDLGLPMAEWGVPDCPESLNKSHPHLIQGIHKRYFEAGADVVETNTFNANHALKEFSIEEQALDLNVRAARNAREVALAFEKQDGQPRFVSGSIGPATKLASLYPPQITFEQLEASYANQVTGLLQGGADVLQIETCQDLMQVKAAVCGSKLAFEKLGFRVPIIVQVTIESTGAMLVGSDVLAAYCTIEPYEEVWAIGMNCGTGPDPMAEHVRALCQVSARHVSCLPNAGLPENVGGKVVFPLQPKPFAEKVGEFVRDFGTGLVGGCCGTTPLHIAELVKHVGKRAPKQRTPVWEPSVASLFGAVPLKQEPPPLLVGERLNAQGSKRVKELLAKEDWDGMLAVAREQVAEGAHVLDVALAFTGRDETKDAATFVPRLRPLAQLPICIDTTEYPVAEEALKRITGRAILNSINLEKDEETLVKKVMLARKHGAACVALTIDERGQATTTDWKVEVAHRIHDLALEHGLRPQDLIFDPLTFPMTTGRDEERRAGIETLEAIKRIKSELPGVYTILGVSNCSFGLDARARVALNSVFLHYAVEAGLDAAIVHAAKIMPLAQIDPAVRELCRRIVFDERTKDSDPLHELIAHYEKLGKKKGAGPAKSGLETLPVEKRLARRIIDGAKTGLEADLDEAMKKGISPIAIINEHLLDGMRVVGDLFGKGEMQLPFVLQSAEVMKAAVRHLEPFMPKKEGAALGTVVLATVKGDVHDIGKNLVDIILSNNGYKVENLGIKIGIDEMLAAKDRVSAAAIGMSGLLVKSTVIMKENLEELNRRGLAPDVILGGAALNRRYVEEDLRAIYKGRVFYAKDAFEGLRLVEALAKGKDPEEVARASRASEKKGSTARVEGPPIVLAPVQPVAPPEPPFWGVKVEKAPAPLDEIFSWINPLVVMRNHFGLKVKGKNHAELLEWEKKNAWPLFEREKKKTLERGDLRPAWTYGWFAARRQGNDVVVLRAPGSSDELTRFSFPRGSERLGGRCIADFFREDRDDVLGLLCVTVGARVSERIRELKEAGQYTDMLYLQGIAAETTEALAEMLHARMRRELGIHGRDAKTREAVIRMQYQGARYSFGYPACPDMEEQREILDLLPAHEIGVTATESAMLEPEFSTAAVVVHHPQARYFSV